MATRKDYQQVFMNITYPTTRHIYSFFVATDTCRTIADVNSIIPILFYYKYISEILVMVFTIFRLPHYEKYNAHQVTIPLSIDLRQ